MLMSHQRDDNLSNRRKVSQEHMQKVFRPVQPFCKRLSLQRIELYDDGLKMSQPFNSHKNGPSRTFGHLMKRADSKA
jgi:hypothetical protein